MQNIIHNRFFKLDSLSFVRILIIIEIILISIFTVGAEIIEVLIFFCIVLSPKLRSRVLSQKKQPLIIATFLFYGIITIGLLYTITDLHQSIGVWGSWRKLLLLPITLSLYDDPIWKRRLILSFVGFITCCAILSFLSHLFSFSIYRYEIGIVLHNHATQGILFSVSIYICLILLRYPPYLKITWIPPLLLTLSIALLFFNVIYITPGRSGYLAIYVFIIIFIFFNMISKWRYFIVCIATVALFSILISSPVAKNRIQMGIDEIQTYKQSQYLTSMGIRMVMWKQTIHLLQHLEYPFFGYGTGAFQKAYKKQVIGINGWQGEVADDPHNQYLRIAVEHGFIGLLIFFAFIVTFFFQKGCKEPPRILAIGVLIAWCITSLFNTHFSTFAEGRFIMIWCGALLASDADSYKSCKINPPIADISKSNCEKMT